jgi:hypothetical protein
MRPLTIKQHLWVDAYLGSANGNGVAAARRAGYKGNDNVLAVTANDNLRNPKIRAEIERILKQSAIGRDELLKRLSDLARQEPEKYDPIRALALLGRYHGLFDRHLRALKQRELDLLQQRIEGKEPPFDLAEAVREAEARIKKRLAERGDSPNGQG